MASAARTVSPVRFRQPHPVLGALVHGQQTTDNKSQFTGSATSRQGLSWRY